MKKICYSIMILILCLIIIFGSISEVKATDEDIPKEYRIDVCYSTHVEQLGWQDEVKNGEIAGTSGKCLRLEGIKINLKKGEFVEEGDIEYSTHIERLGWQDFVKNNELAGTTGKSLRLEAIKIRLTEELAYKYNILYRVHVENFGWLDWAMNGQAAGTEGFGYRLEAIEIKIVSKYRELPTDMEVPYKNKINYNAELENKDINLEEAYAKYSTHVEEIGWQERKQNGETAGTIDTGRRIEAIKIFFHDPTYMWLGVNYRVHIEGSGWQEWKHKGEVAGTEGKGLRIEAIEIKMDQVRLKKYDVYYRVYVQNSGLQEWKQNGETAGTTGQSRRIEAIEIKFAVKKGFNNTIALGYQHGINVSSDNGVIDWYKVKNDGIKFAMIRGGYRENVISSDGIEGKLVEDSEFIYNIEEATKYNLSVGVYFSSQAKTEEEAIQEASFLLERIKNYKISFQVAINVENGKEDNLTKEERTKVVKSFCDTIESAGYVAMIYAGKDCAENKLEMSELFEYDLCMVDYTGATQDDPVIKPSKYKGKYMMWQYTSEGSVEGIEGKVDRNIYYSQVVLEPII